MSRIYKSAKGKVIDMDKVKLSNETVPAIGNMRVNARGDIIGHQGQVSVPRNAVMDRVYAVEEAPYSPNNPENFSGTQQMIDNSKAKQLHDIASNLIKTDTVEPIAEADSTPVPAARGSLAASVAKPQTVTQQPIPNPKKPTGPTRI